MSDEWDVFGSDDEESTNEEDHYLSTSDCTRASLLTFEKISDAIATISTQKFIKKNRSVPIRQRYFGVAGSDADEEVEMMTFKDTLRRKMEQRGMNVIMVNDSQTLFDGASIQRSFHLDHNNTLKCKTASDLFLQEKSLRKNLANGGILFVTTRIIHDEGELESSTSREWKATDILAQWKADAKGEHLAFTKAVWDLENAEISYSDISSGSHSSYTICITKRSCTINTQSCKWKTNQKKVPKSFNNDDCTEETWIDYERRILESATISQSIHEQKNKHLATESIDNAVKSLQTHGFVVLPGLFRHSTEQIGMIEEWTKAVLDDFDAATQILKDEQNVDVLNPGSGSDPLSYREMAMREDFRVDLRDGPRMKEIRLAMEEKDKKALQSLGFTATVTATDDGEGTMPTIIDTLNDERELEINKDGLSSLRYNPFVLEITRKLQNPQALDNSSREGVGRQPLYKGNFGRWNFSGSGPNGSPQPLRVGQIGSVISLPGAADQCVHADTPHICELYDCLPCHYTNLFIFGEDQSENENTSNGTSNLDYDGNFTGGNLIGGTAFVAGSHRLSVTAELTDDKGISASGAAENTQNEMHMRIIRPSLQLGDAIIFDTRILHFGLANRNRMENRGAGLRRPMLYVNMTHAWFFDPKNWDNKQSIFDMHTEK
jgi:hypothetical protein